VKGDCLYLERCFWLSYMGLAKEQLFSISSFTSNDIIMTVTA